MKSENEKYERRREIETQARRFDIMPYDAAMIPGDDDCDVHLTLTQRDLQACLADFAIEYAAKVLADREREIGREVRRLNGLSEIESMLELNKLAERLEQAKRPEGEG